MQGPIFSSITAGAMVPEQLTHYVCAVSGRRAVRCGPYIAYLHQGHAVLVAYPEAGHEHCSAGLWDWDSCTARTGQEGTTEQTEQAMSRLSLGEALNSLRRHCDNVTVLAPFHPAEAPKKAVSSADCYWQIPLPLAPCRQKLRNLLKRAARDITVNEETWTGEHALLVKNYLDRRALSPGTRTVFGNLAGYAAPKEQTVPGVRLFAARHREGTLAGFTLGDFNALRTAFYMFSFRQDDAPPGTADLLLRHLILKAEELGHERVNLGLGISRSITFFKKKWGAIPLAPYRETSWPLKTPSKSVFTGLRRILGR